MFSEWASITKVDYNYGKDENFCTHYNFMGNRATAYWKARGWTPTILTNSRLSPIQTRALCTSDVHDIPRLIQEAEKRIVFFESQQPVQFSLLTNEHVILQQEIQVWELRLEYMIEKYDTAMKFLWPLMRHRRAPDARQGASPSRRGVNHLRHQPSQLRTAQAHHNPLGDLSLTRAALSK